MVIDLEIILDVLCLDDCALCTVHCALFLSFVHSFEDYRTKDHIASEFCF